MGKKDLCYPGVIIIETRLLKKGSDIVLPPRIYVASDYREHYGEAILQHGYGHYLQYLKHGFFYYYFVIGFISVWAAIKRNNYAKSEIEANRLAHHYFKEKSLMGSNLFPI